MEKELSHHQESPQDNAPVDSHQYRENFWYSKENHTKLCTEGAIANMFFHLQMKEEAEEFRKLAVLSEKQLLEVLHQDVVPKRVMNNHHHKGDEQSSSHGSY